MLAGCEPTSPRSPRAGSKDGAKPWRLVRDINPMIARCKISYLAFWLDCVIWFFSQNPPPSLSLAAIISILWSIIPVFPNVQVHNPTLFDESMKPKTDGHDRRVNSHDFHWTQPRRMHRRQQPRSWCGLSHQQLPNVAWIFRLNTREPWQNQIAENEIEIEHISELISYDMISVGYRFRVPA